MSAARELTIRLASKVASPHSDADFRLTHRPIHYAGFIKNHGKNSRKTFSLPLFYHKKSTDRGIMSLYENNRIMQPQKVEQRTSYLDKFAYDINNLT